MVSLYWDRPQRIWLTTGFKIFIVDTCQQVYIMVKRLLCELIDPPITPNNTMVCYPVESETCEFILQYPEEIYDMANEGSSLFSPSIAGKQDVGSEKNTTSCCKVSICWYQSSVRMMAVTSGAKMVLGIFSASGNIFSQYSSILEMAVYDCYCPHSCLYLGSITVDFIMWFIEFGLDSDS